MAKIIKLNWIFFVEKQDWPIQNQKPYYSALWLYARSNKYLSRILALMSRFRISDITVKNGEKILGFLGPKWGGKKKLPRWKSQWQSGTG